MIDRRPNNVERKASISLMRVAGSRKVASRIAWCVWQPGV